MFSKGSEAGKPSPFDGNDPDCIRVECGGDYRTRSGLTAPLNRLGMLHRKLKPISSKLDPTKQARFVAAYEALMDGVHWLMGDELIAASNHSTRRRSGNGQISDVPSPASG